VVVFSKDMGHSLIINRFLGDQRLSGNRILVYYGYGGREVLEISDGELAVFSLGIYNRSTECAWFRLDLAKARGLASRLRISVHPPSLRTVLMSLELLRTMYVVLRTKERRRKPEYPLPDTITTRSNEIPSSNISNSILHKASQNQFFAFSPIFPEVAHSQLMEVSSKSSIQNKRPNEKKEGKMKVT
jgi:hypothetical protein